MVMKTIHIDTLKSGWTGKYLAFGHEARTECSEKY